MSSHQVIARKWRPQKFGDVVGQTHVIRTLRNAIAGDRVGHAYLLVGPRGIGKTTIARIFAKAINCENPVDGEPCCSCQSCTALANESSLDVIEIDAASRNSVEHMRALSEEAYHMPVSSKYKIYIIDEVHMLSKAAWNALLKTVEEPPSHVKFIFATTEAHLVLPTIVSRCQRFDLRPIAGNLILQRLKLIAESENVKIAPEALSAIARAAEGGMRDAQSSLEQMLAFFGGKDQEIAAEQVLELFGMTNAVELDTLIAAMLQNQPGPVVTIVNQLAGRGRNLETLFDDILEMLRGAELMQLLNNPEAVLDFEDEKLARCRKLSQLTNADVLRCFMEQLAPVGRILHEALNKAIYLESILLKAMHEAHAPTVGDVLRRLNQLRGAGELQFIEQIPSFQERPPLAMSVVLPEAVPPKVQTIPESVAEEPVKEAIAIAETVADNTSATNSTPIAEAVANNEPAVNSAPMAEAVAEVQPMNEATDLTDSAAGSVTPDNGQTIEPPVAAANETVTDCESLWSKLLAAAQGGALEALLSQCTAQGLTNSVLTISASNAALDDLRRNRAQIMLLLQQVSGDWAILPEFKSNEPTAETAEIPTQSAGDTAVETPAVQEDAPEQEEFIEISVNDCDVIIDSVMDSNPAPQEEEFTFIGSEDVADDNGAMQSAAESVYSKRSVIHKSEEVEATAQLPPVRKVLDLFDGEIVDIHA